MRFCDAALRLLALRIFLAGVSGLALAQPPVGAAPPADAMHAWVGLKDPAVLEGWVNWHIAEEWKAVAELLAAKGTRTVENTLALYDRAQMNLSVAGDQTQIMFEVHPQKGVRDKAQALVRMISDEATSLSLNQPVYKSLKAVDVSAADGPTKHYAERILLEYRLGELLYTTYSLNVHDRPPAEVDVARLWKEACERFDPYQYVDGGYFFTSFTHLTGYGSNYYTYLLDKVIAVDFFAQFDPKNILDGPAALRYRKTVLEPGSSKPAAELVKDFLGRPENIDALKKWMDKEFEPAGGVAAGR